MKSSVIGILFVLIFGYSQAQNPFFVDFKTSKADLISFLELRKAKSSDHDDHVQAMSGDNSFVYKYNPKGELFKIEMFRNFKKKKEAEENLNSLLYYFKVQQSTLFVDFESPEKVKHVAIKDDVVQEIYMLKCESGVGYQVKLIKRNPETDLQTDKGDDGLPSENFSLSMTD